jgi:hypothetical protein
MPFDGSGRVTPISDAMRKYFDGGRMWGKGSLGSPGRPMCLVGAYSFVLGKYATRVAFTEHEYVPLHAALRAIGVDDTHLGTIARWNDAPSRTYADIERFLDAFADFEAKENLSV